MVEFDSPLIFLSDYDDTVILFFTHPGKDNGVTQAHAYVDRCLSSAEKAITSEAFRILGALICHMAHLGFPTKDIGVSPLPPTMSQNFPPASPTDAKSSPDLAPSPLRQNWIANWP